MRKNLFMICIFLLLAGMARGQSVNFTVNYDTVHPGDTVTFTNTTAGAPLSSMYVWEFENYNQLRAHPPLFASAFDTMLTNTPLKKVFNDVGVFTVRLRLVHNVTRLVLGTQVKVIVVEKANCNLTYTDCDLLMNGDFEQWDVNFSSPWAIGDLDSRACNWGNTLPGINAPASPDLFYFNSNNPDCDVPDNLFGHQPAHSQQLYAGIITYKEDVVGNQLSEYREYIQSLLHQQLYPGQQYVVGMYVNLSDHSKYATNGLGIVLTEDQPRQQMLGTWCSEFNYSGSTTYFQLQPVIETNTPIVDKNHWVLLTDTITAVNYAQYLTIGNFKNNTQTSVTNLDPGNNIPEYTILDPSNGTSQMRVAYYYIDDVFIKPLHYGKNNNDTICIGDTVHLTSPLIPDFVYVYNWSTGAHTEEIIVQPGVSTTYYCTATDVWGCVQIDTFNVVVLPQSVDFATHNICLGDQICFNGMLSCPASVSSWAWSFGDNTGASGQNPCHVYTQAGTYPVTVIANMPSGAHYSNTHTVTVFALPQPTIMGNLSACSGVQNYTITNWNAQYSYQYSLNNMPPVSISSAMFSINWNNNLNGGMLIVSLSSAMGCKSSDTLYIAECCTKPGMNNYPGGTITSQSQWPTGQKITINGTVTIATNITTQGQRIYMAANAKIIVNAGKTLTMTTDTLLACNNTMWDGIYLNGTTSILNMTRCKVMDAKNAIMSVNGGPYKVSSCVFDKNYKCALVQNYAGAFSGTFSSCSFTCTGNLIAQLPPVSCQKTLCGIEVTNVGTPVASPTAATPGLTVGTNNTFDGLYVAIKGTLSNIKTQSNTFKNIAAPLNIAPSGAICMTGSTNLFPVPTLKYMLTVGGAATTKNTFTNCVKGIVVDRNVNLDIGFNTFTTIHSACIDYQLNFATNAGAKIYSNTMTNVMCGIIGTANAGCKHQITSNTITTKPIGTAIVMNGFNSNTEVVRILTNKIYAKTGISLNSLKNAEVNSNYPISIISANGSGIIATNCYGIKVYGNSVSATDSTNSYGIIVENSANQQTSCNTVTKLRYGLCFKGNCFGSYTSSVQQNTMNNCKYGLVKMNTGKIGIQGNLGYPSNNVWNSCTNATWCFNSQGNIDMLFVKNAPGCNPIISQWQFSGNPLFYSAFTKNANAALQTRLCAIMISKSTDPAFLNKIAQNYFMLRDSELELTQQALYRLIMNDSTLLTSNSSLQNFRSMANMNEWGKLMKIENKICSGDLSNARMMNDAINPASTIENNQKWIYASLTGNLVNNKPIADAGQRNNIMDLALSCPFIEGTAVYYARTLIATMDTLITYTDNCDLITPKSMKVQDEVVLPITFEPIFNVYPNPTNDLLTIDYDLNGEKDVWFEIFDIMGIKKISCKLSKSESTKVISVANLSPAVYLYTIMDEGKILKTGRIVVIK